MSHLTEKQRYTIESMLLSGHDRKSICKAIGKDKSVLSRELKRNSDGRNGVYKHALAQRKCMQRHSSKVKKIKLTTEVKATIKELLSQKFSPEQIVGYCKKHAIPMVSHERIYQCIWWDKKKKGDLYSHLRTEGKRYRKRGSYKDKRGIITNKTMIADRPKVVDEKLRFGDLEMDTIIGKNHQGAILTINDRLTGMLWMKKLTSKDASQVEKAAIELLQPLLGSLKTITSDNGKEFAQHQSIADKLKIDYYFANPYHSWERGAIENLNGLIRQYIPKKTDFSTLTDQQILNIQNQINNRPRKRFNFESPSFMFNQKVAFIT